VSPFKTPEFGNWLNNRSYEFDIIACWKMDRLSRRGHWEKAYQMCHACRLTRRPVTRRSSFLM
ncbi:hypothetical protein, partial [Streptosporangium canum]|uniref:hypothetical protein n=1 Tax=Streptosporangium canum TaxID=324952 RepID=UPI0033B1B672